MTLESFSGTTTRRLPSIAMTNIKGLVSSIVPVIEIKFIMVVRNLKTCPFDTAVSPSFLAFSSFCLRDFLYFKFPFCLSSLAQQTKVNKLLKNKEMVFENGVKKIQAAAYNGASTVYTVDFCIIVNMAAMMHFW